MIDFHDITKRAIFTFAVILCVFVIVGEARAANYYFSASAGNDSWDCTAGEYTTGTTGPCKTIAKLNSMIVDCIAGDDFYLRTGDVWERAQLAAGCPGASAANQTIIGAYWMNGSTPTICAEDDSNCTAEPTVRGGYTSPGNYGSIPGYIHSGLVYIYGANVYVQNLNIIDSSGNGVNIDAVDSKVAHNTISNSVWSCIKVNGPADRNHSYNNLCDGIVMGRHDEVLGLGSNPIKAGKHPGCIQGINGADHMVFENNLVYNCWGEGISCSQGGDYCIIRGNIVANSPYYVALYTNGGLAHVLEKNILVGNPGSTRNEMDGISCALESSSIGNINNCIVRNNFIAGLDEGIYIGMFSSARTNGNTIGFDIAGNTIVGVNKAFRQPLSATNTTASYFRNNLIYDADNDGGSVGECDAVTNAEVTFDGNSWTTSTGLDADCVNSGTTYYGDPGFAYPGDLRTSFDRNNLPTSADLKPNATGIADNNGIDLDATATTDLNGTNFTSNQTSKITFPTTTFDTNLLGYDIDGDARHATTPDIGAVEIASAPSQPTKKTVPYCENVGGPLVSNAIGSTDCVAENTDSHTNSFNNSHSDTITGATSITAHQTWARATTSGQLKWDVPLNNGCYDWTGYFHEQFHGDEQNTCTNLSVSRTFDISIEGALVFDEIDFCALVGEANKEVKVIAPNICITDEEINIVMTPGSLSAIDTKPEAMFWLIDTADPNADTLTLNDNAPSINLVNNYGKNPNTTTVNIPGVCGATSTASPPDVVVDSIDTQPSLGTFTNVGGGYVEYSPANANTGNISAQFTLADANGSEVCTPSFNLVATASIKGTFIVNGIAKTNIANAFWEVIPCNGDCINLDKAMVSPVRAGNSNLSTNASAQFEINDSRLDKHKGERVWLRVEEQAPPFGIMFDRFKVQ